jgi:hypothetical protein
VPNVDLDIHCGGVRKRDKRTLKFHPDGRCMNGPSRRSGSWALFRVTVAEDTKDALRSALPVLDGSQRLVPVCSQFGLSHHCYLDDGDRYFTSIYLLITGPCEYNVSSWKCIIQSQGLPQHSGCSFELRMIKQFMSLEAHIHEGTNFSTLGPGSHLTIAAVQPYVIHGKFSFSA